MVTRDPYRHEGLPLIYRFWWKFEWLLLHVYGPAQLSQGQDPRRRMVRERANRQAHARAERLGISVEEARSQIAVHPVSRHKG